MSSRLRSVDGENLKRPQAFHIINMTYRLGVSQPELALAAVLRGHGSNLTVHHSGREVRRRMYRSVVSGDDPNAPVPQQCKLPTMLGRHVRQKSGARAHFSLRSARPRKATPPSSIRPRQGQPCTLSHLVVRPSSALILLGGALGGLYPTRRAVGTEGLDLGVWAWREKSKGAGSCSERPSDKIAQVTWSLARAKTHQNRHFLVLRAAPKIDQSHRCSLSCGCR